MPHWSEKPIKYKIGVGIQLVGFLLYLIGFASPAWTQIYSIYSPTKISSYHGLWQMCIESLAYCKRYEDFGGSIRGWHQACRVMAAIGFAGSLVAQLMILKNNCSKLSRDLARETTAVRMVPTFGGIMGLLSAATYGIVTQVMLSPTAGDLSWGFACITVGSVLLISCCCLLVATPTPPRPPRSEMQTWTTGVASDGSAGFAFWPGGPSVSGPMPIHNPAFQDVGVVKPPEFCDAPPSYEEVIRGNV